MIWIADLALELDGIDDVERAWVSRDGDHDPPVLGDRDVVRMPAERDLLDEVAGLLVEHVKRGIGFVADIDPRAVGRERHAVGGLDALDGRTRPCWSRDR